MQQRTRHKLCRGGLGLRVGGRATYERPSTGILHAEVHSTTAARPAGEWLAAVGGYQQRPQSAKAIRRDQPERHKLAECFFKLWAQQ